MIIRADSLAPFPLPDASVQCCITSPPYWGLRDYGVDGQLGLESTPEEYVERLVDVFREVWRVLRDDGTVWVNLGDSYASSGTGNNGNEGYSDGRSNRTARLGGRSVRSLKPKDLIGIPWRVAFALQADGWYLRSDIIWHKPNPMPESVTDRPTKAHEYVFLLSKSQKYFYDVDAVRVPQSQSTLDRFRPGQVSRKNGPKNSERTGKPTEWAMQGGILDNAMRNRRTVWTIPTQPTPEAHFAAFPEALVEPCVLAGSAQGDLVLDPFGGTGTTVKVAQRLGRKAVALEISAEYCHIAHAKTWQTERQIQLLDALEKETDDGK